MMGMMMTMEDHFLTHHLFYIMLSSFPSRLLM